MVSRRPSRLLWHSASEGCRIARGAGAEVLAAAEAAGKLEPDLIAACSIAMEGAGRAGGAGGTGGAGGGGDCSVGDCGGGVDDEGDSACGGGVMRLTTDKGSLLVGAGLLVGSGLEHELAEDGESRSIGISLEEGRAKSN